MIHFFWVTKGDLDEDEGEETSELGGEGGGGGQLGGDEGRGEAGGAAFGSGLAIAQAAPYRIASAVRQVAHQPRVVHRQIANVYHTSAERGLIRRGGTRDVVLDHGRHQMGDGRGLVVQPAPIRLRSVSLGQVAHDPRVAHPSVDANLAAQPRGIRQPESKVKHIKLLLVRLHDAKELVLVPAAAAPPATAAVALSCGWLSWLFAVACG